jgi:zinc transport system substrate-binding protein
LADFVERVGGDRVIVEVLVPPGQSPATYEPSPKQMARLAEAPVYFRVGSPFEESFASKLASTHPDLQVVDLREGVTLRRMAEHHEHGEGCDHGQKGADPHVWLDPLRVKILAETVGSALARLAPEHEAEFRRNLARFHEDLDGLHGRIERILLPLKGREIFVFHPAYGYFTDRYGLIQVAVEMGGKEPGPRRLATLIERARERGVKVIFVQPQFSRKSAQAIADAVGGAVVPLDPLARDCLSNLETMATVVEKALAR